MTTPVAPAVSPEDSVLDYTQSQRQKIIDHLAPGGKINEDPKYVQIMLATLDGMDRAALSKKKIKVEEKANQTQEQTAGLIAEMLTRTAGVLQGVAPVPRSGPVMLPADIPDPVLVEGETSTNASQRNYDDFMAEQNRALALGGTA